MLVTDFLYCIVQIVKINFGSMVITHITLRPYKISLLLLTMFLLLSTTQLFYFDVLYESDDGSKKPYE